MSRIIDCINADHDANQKQLVKYRNRDGHISSGVLVDEFESVTKRKFYCVGSFSNRVLSCDVISITPLKESWI